MKRMKEIWKPVPTDIYYRDVKDIYEVSNTGKVRNKKTGKLLSQRRGQGPQQSYRVTLCGERDPRLNFNVSKLVYNAFCDPNQRVKEYGIITFKDGDPSNCRFDNLLAL